MNANDLIEMLMDYYNVSSYNELAEKLNMQPSSISSWKNKNSVKAIKKKCRELGIYKDIFGDIKTSSITQGDNARAANGNYIEHALNQPVNTKFEDLTISLVKKCINKYGSEENFQFKLMDLLQDASR